MPAVQLDTPARVLRVEPRGDKLAELVLLSPDEGVLRAFHRPAATRPAPGLLDLLAARLQRRPGGAWFLPEFTVTAHPAGLARRLEALTAASRFARLLAANPVAEGAAGPLFALANRVIAGCEASARPDAALLKGTYLYARAEGLPVREEWLAGLAPDLQPAAATILARPLGDQTAPPALVARLQESLERWLAGAPEIRFG